MIPVLSRSPGGRSRWASLCFALCAVSCDPSPPSGDADVEPDADADLSIDGDVEGQPPVPEGCNPLAPEWDCLLPYPSDVFLVEDEARPGERRVVHGAPGLPLAEGAPVDLVDQRPANGFSRVPNVLALFPGGVDDGDLPSQEAPLEVSTGEGSPTVLLDVERGERVPHFAELDPRTTDRARQALVIHPLVPLRFAARYVVAIRDLSDPAGQLIDAPSGFARLRDGDAAGQPTLAGLAARYEADLFVPLEAAGVERQSLQLAWDFTTVTRENRAGDLLRLRELALETFEATPPVVTVLEEDVQDDVDEHVFRRVEGSLEVPLFLESLEPGASLNRDAEGLVTQRGTAAVEFLALIPRSVAEGVERQRPARIVQYGHGFFGTRAELDKTFPRTFADEAGVVLVGVDWWGMADQDKLPISNDIFSGIGQVFRFTDRVHQAMVNQIALTYAVRAGLSEVEALRVDGELAYDPAELYFYGLSNGHILGGVYLGLSPHIERAALGSGGCDFSLMMFRSMPFGALLFLIEMVIEDPLDLQKFAALGQLPLDAIDPATYLELVLDEPLAGGPSHRDLLMFTGLGDPYVPNVATRLHARALGLPLLQPTAEPVAGLEPREGPIAGSAYAEYFFDVGSPAPGDLALIPSEDNGVHQAARALEPAIRQVDAFLRPEGTVRSFCDGLCDPD